MPWALRVWEPPAGVLQQPHHDDQQVLGQFLLDITTPQELLQGVELSFGGQRGGVELHLLLLGKI